ncbi:MAG: isocitrate/isopropylmalate family dehydrogenase [Pseudomonadota bacterium]
MPTETYSIAYIPGDGVGVDVSDAAIAIVSAAGARIGGFALSLAPVHAGAAYYSEEGVDLEPGGEAVIAGADAILLGAIGLPNVRRPDGTEISPHLRLRDQLQLYAGVRPIKAFANTPLRLADPRAAEIDCVIVRESTEGLFYSAAAHGRGDHLNAGQPDEECRDILRITRPTTEKLHDFAFRLARKRKARGGPGHVTCVDKANVFRSMAFFRKVFDERAGQFPEIGARHNYVDAQALDFIRKPWAFDVLVSENMFGDILSDLAGGLVGGMGMAACAEIGDAHALFQPAHGSAPDIMGQDKANPTAAILSAAMMLEYLGERADRDEPRIAGELIAATIERGYAEQRLRPIEIGGDMGTAAFVKETLALIDETNLNAMA